MLYVEGFNNDDVFLLEAPCAVVRPWEAIVIGAIGGVIAMFGTRMFDRLHVDDPVGAVSVHGLCGIWVSEKQTKNTRKTPRYAPCSLLGAANCSQMGQVTKKRKFQTCISINTLIELEITSCVLAM